MMVTDMNCLPFKLCSVSLNFSPIQPFIQNAGRPAGEFYQMRIQNASTDLRENSENSIFWIKLWMLVAHQNKLYIYIRGGLNIILAKNGGVQIPPPPLSAKNQKLAYPPLPPLVRKTQKLANPPSPLVRNHILLHSN